MILVLIWLGALCFSGMLFWLTRSVFGAPASKRWLLFGILMLVAGSALSAYAWREIASILAYRNWPVVEAVVLDSRVEGKRAFHPVVVFQYESGGVTYTDSTDLAVPGFGSKANRMWVAETNADRYSKGARIGVHVNPERPSQALIKIFPKHTLFILLALSVCLISAGGYGLLVFIRNRPK